MEPHRTHPSLTAGLPLAKARRAVLMFHGRGASAADMLGLAAVFSLPGYAVLAPQADQSTWYPYSFLSPRHLNEPHLSAALSRGDELIRQILAAGLPPEKIVLLGFSQGACLALETAVRYPRRYGALVGFSGGLIGPAEQTWPLAPALDGVPVFLGCSDVDPHIPVTRVEESARYFTTCGARVDVRLYPQMAHTVIQAEIEAVQALLTAV